MRPYNGGFLYKIQALDPSITGIVVTAPCIPVYDNMVVQGEVVTTTDGDWVRQQIDCIAQEIATTPTTTVPGVIIPGVLAIPAVPPSGEDPGTPEVPAVPPVIGEVAVPYTPPPETVLPGAHIAIPGQTSVETFLDFGEENPSVAGAFVFMHKKVTDISNPALVNPPVKFIGYQSDDAGGIFNKLPNYILPITANRNFIAYRPSDGLALSFYIEQPIISLTAPMYMVKIRYGVAPVYSTFVWTSQTMPLSLTCDGTYFYALSKTGFLYRSEDGDSWAGLGEFQDVTPADTYRLSRSYMKWNSFNKRWLVGALGTLTLLQSKAELLTNDLYTAMMSNWEPLVGIPNPPLVWDVATSSYIYTWYRLDIPYPQVEFQYWDVFIKAVKVVTNMRLGTQTFSHCMFTSYDLGETWVKTLELDPYSSAGTTWANAKISGPLERQGALMAFADDDVGVTYIASGQGYEWLHYDNELGLHDNKSWLSTGNAILVLIDGIPHITNSGISFSASIVNN